jgi:protein gp37
MSENSKIEWTDHTFNPWTGCTKISPGCAGCYAESWAKRSGHVEWGGPRRRTTVEYWQQPFRWNDKAKAEGVRRRVFCASLADVFDNTVPAEWRADLFRLIHNTPNLDWLLLTKRIGNARDMISEARIDGHLLTSGSKPWPWPNVWIGATVVNQAEAERDVPKLLAVPAAVHFLSCEPLLGPIDLGAAVFCRYCGGEGSILRGPDDFACSACDGHRRSLGELADEGLDWVIVGGESGGKARPMLKGWAVNLRDECAGHGVAFFMKQGSAANWPHYKNFDSFPDALRVREFPRARA